MNIYLEQYFSACLAYHTQENIVPLRHEAETWEQLNTRYAYTHLISTSKLKFGRQVEERVKRDFPAHYARILQTQKSLSPLWREAVLG